MNATTITHPFGEFVADKHNTDPDHFGGSWEQYTFSFPNGYGASVVRGGYTYGGSEGLWELAVLDADGHLTYNTPITDDVGHLEPFDVGRHLEAISKLEKAG